MRLGQNEQLVSVQKKIKADPGFSISILSDFFGADGDNVQTPRSTNVALLPVGCELEEGDRGFSRSLTLVIPDINETPEQQEIMTMLVTEMNEQRPYKINPQSETPEGYLEMDPLFVISFLVETGLSNLGIIHEYDNTFTLSSYAIERNTEISDAYNLVLTRIKYKSEFGLQVPKGADLSILESQVFALRQDIVEQMGETRFGYVQYTYEVNFPACKGCKLREICPEHLASRVSRRRTGN